MKSSLIGGIAGTRDLRYALDLGGTRLKLVLQYGNPQYRPNVGEFFFYKGKDYAGGMSKRPALDSSAYSIGVINKGVRHQLFYPAADEPGNGDAETLALIQPLLAAMQALATALREAGSPELAALELFLAQYLQAIAAMPSEFANMGLYPPVPTSFPTDADGPCSVFHRLENPLAGDQL